MKFVTREIDFKVEILNGIISFGSSGEEVRLTLLYTNDFFIEAHKRWVAHFFRNCGGFVKMNRVVLREVDYTEYTATIAEAKNKMYGYEGDWVVLMDKDGFILTIPKELKDLFIQPYEEEQSRHFETREFKVAKVTSEFLLLRNELLKSNYSKVEDDKVLLVDGDKVFRFKKGDSLIVNEGHIIAVLEE